jgi:peroxin-6
VDLRLTRYRGVALGSPLLLHNTYEDEASMYAPQPPHAVIKPSPFGSLNPAIPMARSITIARVASPLSINRQYQNLFISSLKSYFDSSRRLVKQGDLIAVTIDTDASRFAPESDDATEGVEETTKLRCAC